MKLYHVDLHIHTVLSPCAELDMGAPEIIARCRDEGIDMIAITDHNSARN
ncbi:MAG: Putative PHP domain protein, partial [Synergistales bacterium 57_84]